MQRDTQGIKQEMPSKKQSYLDQIFKNPKTSEELLMNIFPPAIKNLPNQFVLLDELKNIYEALYRIAYILIKPSQIQQNSNLLNDVQSSNLKFTKIIIANSYKQMNEVCFQKWSKGVRINLIVHEDILIQTAENIQNPQKSMQKSMWKKIKFFVLRQKDKELNFPQYLRFRQNIKVDDIISFKDTKQLPQVLAEESIRKHRLRNIPNFSSITNFDKTRVNTFRYILYWMLNPINIQKALEQFVEFCENSAEKQDSLTGQIDLEEIKQLFQKTLQTGESPHIVFLYSKESFFYKLFNNSLRILRDPSQMAYLRLPFNLLFRKVYNLFTEQMWQKFVQEDTICYRGCYLTEQQVKTLEGNIGGFIQTEGFLSTSLAKDVGKFFGTHLLQIRIPKLQASDSMVNLTGFAEISEYSASSQERELLFNPLNYFKIVGVEIQQGSVQKTVKLQYVIYGRIIEKSKKRPNELTSQQRQLISNSETQVEVRKNLKSQANCFMEIFNYKKAFEFCIHSFQTDVLNKIDEIIGYSQINFMAPQEQNRLDKLSGELIDEGDLKEIQDQELINLVIKKQVIEGSSHMFRNLCATAYRNNFVSKAKIYIEIEIFISKMRQKRAQWNHEEEKELWGTQKMLALLESQCGKQYQAIDLLKDLIKRGEKMFGASSKQVLQAKQNLSTVYSKCGNFDQSSKIMEEILMANPDKEDSGSIFYQKGKNYEKNLKYIQAIECYKKCLQMYDMTIGQQNQSYITALDDLGRCYLNTCQFDLSLSTYQKCKELQIKYRGTSHPLYALALANIAAVYKQLGHLNKALDLYLECKEIQQKNGIEGQRPLTELTFTLSSISSIYQQKNDLPRAKQFILQAKSLLESRQSTHLPSYQSVLRTLSSIVLKEKNYEQCFRLRVQAKDNILLNFGQMSLKKVEIDAEIAIAQTYRGNYSKARKLFENSLVVLEKLGEKISSHAIRILIYLGESYKVTNDHEQSIEYYEKAIQVIKAQKPINEVELCRGLQKRIQNAKNQQELSKHLVRSRKSFLVSTGGEIKVEGKGTENQQGKEQQPKVRQQGEKQSQIGKKGNNISLGDLLQENLINASVSKNYLGIKNIIQTLSSQMDQFHDKINQSFFYLKTELCKYGLKVAIRQGRMLGLLEVYLEIEKSKIRNEPMIVQQMRNTEMYVIVEDLVPFLLYSFFDKTDQFTIMQGEYQNIGQILSKTEYSTKKTMGFRILFLGSIIEILQGKKTLNSNSEGENDVKIKSLFQGQLKNMVQTNLIPGTNFPSSKQLEKQSKLSIFSAQQIISISTNQQYFSQSSEWRKDYSLQMDDEIETFLLKEKPEKENIKFLLLLAVCQAFRNPHISHKIIKIISGLISSSNMNQYIWMLFSLELQLVSLICTQKSDQERIKDLIKSVEEKLSLITILLDNQGYTEEKMSRIDIVITYLRKIYEKVVADIVEQDQEQNCLEKKGDEENDAGNNC